MTTTKALVAGLAMVVAIGACDQNESGNVGATKLGDTTHPATRKSPVADLQQACGAPGGMLPLNGLSRKPYLQQVTTTEATVGWVADSKAAQSVEVTLPDGKSVTKAAAAPERNAVRMTGGTQTWTKLASLQPDTIYCYQVVSDGKPVSERIGFRTAPTADSPRTIGVLAFGDSGGGTSDQQKLRAQMENVDYQLIVHTGDLAYDDGTMSQLEDTVFGVYDVLFRHIPFFPSAGNHDYNTDNAEPFREVFDLPRNGNGETWYSYDWGRVHFVALDTESDYKTQAKWLDEDLAASKLPWKIVYMHRPPYSSGNHGSDTELRELLAPIFEKHHVQLVLTGHDHHYERMKPQNGVAYVVTGGGGRGTYATGTSDFTAFSESVIHYVYLEVGVDELVLHAIDAMGTEFDSMVVPR